MKDDKNFMNGTFEVSYIYTKVYETTNFHATILFLDFIIQNNGLLNTIFYYSNGEHCTSIYNFFNSVCTYQCTIC